MCVCECVCVCKCACQVVQELFDSKELVQETRDGKALFGMPTYQITKGRKVSNVVKLEAFKKLDQQQIQEYQDAFANVFSDVCSEMDIQDAIADMPQSIQSQHPLFQFMMQSIYFVLLVF